MTSIAERKRMDDSLESRRLRCLERFADAWNAHDVDALMACMAENCEFLSSAGPDACGTQYSGREAVRAGYAAVFESFPDAAWNNPRHSVFGDRGLSEWRFTGIGRDGSRADIHGCDLFIFDGELIRVKDSFRKQRR
jgi:ketosteroid isomerase-like protein